MKAQCESCGVWTFLKYLRPVKVGSLLMRICKKCRLKMEER